MKHCKEKQHGRKYYKCEECPQFFGKPGELRRHIDNKHVVDEQKLVYKCTAEGCTRFYAYERNLKQHQLTAHSGKRFECTVTDCKRLFSSSQNLQNHMKREHDGGTSSCLITTKVKPETVKQRKKRKDAGQAVMSKLAKLSGLVVDKTTDKLLRTREKLTLDNVQMILQENHHEESAREESEMECVNILKESMAKVAETEKTQVREMQIEDLLDIALQDE